MCAIVAGDLGVLRQAVAARAAVVELHVDAAARQRRRRPGRRAPPAREVDLPAADGTEQARLVACRRRTRPRRCRSAASSRLRRALFLERRRQALAALGDDRERRGVPLLLAIRLGLHVRRRCLRPSSSASGFFERLLSTTAARREQRATRTMARSQSHADRCTIACAADTRSCGASHAASSATRRRRRSASTSTSTAPASGRSTTPVPFLTHMLDAFARHGLFDLDVQAAGDIEIDGHHTVEDIGLVLGNAFEQALGDRAGIVRYGSATLPMDEVLVDRRGRLLRPPGVRVARRRPRGQVDRRLRLRAGEGVLRGVRDARAVQPARACCTTAATRTTRSSASSRRSRARATRRRGSTRGSAVRCRRPRVR